MSPLNKRGGDFPYGHSPKEGAGCPSRSRVIHRGETAQKNILYFPVPEDMVGMPEVVKRNGDEPYIGFRIDSVCGRVFIALLNSRRNTTQTSTSFDSTLTPSQIQLAAVNLARGRYGLGEMDPGTYFGGIRS